MVEVLFLLLGGTLAFVYMQYEQKKDLENRIKTLESDYISLCTQINQTERNVYDTLKEEVHSLKADMWSHLHAHEVDIRGKKIKEILKD